MNFARKAQEYFQECFQEYMACLNILEFLSQTLLQDILSTTMDYDAKSKQMEDGKKICNHSFIDVLKDKNAFFEIEYQLLNDSEYRKYKKERIIYHHRC